MKKKQDTSNSIILFMKALKLTLLLSFFHSFLFSQTNEVNRNSFLSTGLIQIKEGANFGLVFKGPEINYGMTWYFVNDARLITYEYELGLETPFTKGIPALGAYLKPVDIAYMFKLPGSLYTGPSLKFEYQYNLYPDLQSAFDYWFTNFSFGVNTQYDFKYKKSSFRVKLNSSLLGFVSRQPDYRGPYFYDIGFAFAIRHLHQDLRFETVNNYSTSNLEIQWKPKPGYDITFGYELSYSRYSRSPEITLVNHSLKLIFNKK